MRAGELVRIGVVNHDVAIAWQRRKRAVAVVANGARKTDRAVFVRVLEACIDEDGRAAAVELLLEFFFGDSRDRHAANCRRALAGLSTGPSASLRAGPSASLRQGPSSTRSARHGAVERHDTRSALRHDSQLRFCGFHLETSRRRRLLIDRPPR